MKLVLILLALTVLAVVLLIVAVTLPGRSFRGALPPATRTQQQLAAQLRRDVETLAPEPRNVFIPERLHAAQRHIEDSLAADGYAAERQTYVVDGVRCTNITAERRGTADGIVVIGAHYDSVDDAPGADDNASGTAAVLALAKRFANASPRQTLRFVFFVNEEPPHFMTAAMGSYQSAKRSHERGEKIVAMLSVETVGYYDTRPKTQHYPAGLAMFYPDRGDFIAFAGNFGSHSLLRRALRTFRRSAQFPAEGAALPAAVPGVAWSDHWSYWQFGWQAILVTDTAFFRNPHYHQRTDTPETLDYDRLSRVVEGLGAVVEDLTR